MWAEGGEEVVSVDFLIASGSIFVPLSEKKRETAACLVPALRVVNTIKILKHFNFTF